MHQVMYGLWQFNLAKTKNVSMREYSCIVDFPGKDWDFPIPMLDYQKVCKKITRKDIAKPCCSLETLPIL